MSNEIRSINTEELDFDPENPRFYRLNDRAGSEIAVIEEMIDVVSEQELMLSMNCLPVLFV